MSELERWPDGDYILILHEYADDPNEYLALNLDHSFKYVDTPEGWNYWVEVYHHLGLTKLVEYA